MLLEGRVKCLQALCVIGYACDQEDRVACSHLLLTFYADQDTTIQHGEYIPCLFLVVS